MSRSQINLDALRSRAEAALAVAEGHFADPEKIAPPQMRDLVQELRIYQAELEIQNLELEQSQVAEAEASAKYRDIFNGMPVPALLCDAHTLIIEANQAALDFLNLRSSSIQQRYAFEQFVDIDNRGRISGSLRRGLPLHQQPPFQVQIKPSGGIPTHCEVRLMPFAAGEEPPSLFLVMIIDKRLEHELARLESDLQHYDEKLEDIVADRVRKLNEAELLYHTIANFAFDWESWIDPDGAFVYSSPSCKRITGRAAEDFIADPGLLLKITHPQDRSRLEAHLQWPQNDSQPQELRFRISLPDGQTRWLECGGQAVQGCDGRMLGRRTSMRDITDRMRDQELLKERAEALAVAKRAAESASLAKSNFLATMSHELRTPLNAIVGMNSLAQMRMTDPKGRDQLGKVRSAADHLLSVINDILDLSKLEAERLTLDSEVFTLGKVMEDISILTQQRAAEKGLVYEHDLPLALSHRPLRGDPLRLKQVLLNLTGNAVKFSMRGVIRVVVRQEDGELPLRLRFEVIDQGIGIPVLAQGRLFNAFEQADSSMTRKYGGTGLGLSISKRLVNMMGGEIGVFSEPEVGSRFWFTVTLETTDDELAAAPPATPMDQDGALRRLRLRHANARVLLAEDEPISQELMQLLLQDAGLSVEAVDDGLAAVDRASQQKFDLILLDMQMPRLSGIDAVRAIRQLPGYRDTPILATTANAFDEDRDACIAAGMNEHLGKPIDPEVLYATLNRWLDRSI